MKRKLAICADFDQFPFEYDILPPSGSPFGGVLSACALELLPPSWGRDASSAVNTLFGHRKICAFSGAGGTSKKAHILKNQKLIFTYI